MEQAEHGKKVKRHIDEVPNKRDVSFRLWIAIAPKELLLNRKRYDRERPIPAARERLIRSHPRIEVLINIRRKYFRNPGEPFLHIVVVEDHDAVIERVEIGEGVGVEEQTENNKDGTLNYFVPAKAGSSWIGFSWRAFSIFNWSFDEQTICSLP